MWVVSTVDFPVCYRCPGDSASAESTISSMPWEDSHVLRLKLNLQRSLRHNQHPDNSVRRSYGSYLTCCKCQVSQVEHSLGLVQTHVYVCTDVRHFS